MRREERGVWFDRRQAALAAPLGIRRHAPLQLVGIAQLVVAVGDLDSMHDEFETFRRAMRVQLRERGLARWKARHEQARRGGSAQRFVEQEAERGVRVGRVGQPERLRRLRQASLVGGLQVHVEGVAQQLGVAAPFAWRRPKHDVDQRRRLVHERRGVGVAPIPLDHRELGIVPTAFLAAPKHRPDLEDGGSAGRQQALHVVLGRGLQEVPVHGAQAVDGRVGDGAPPQHRRLHFEHLARSEEAAHGLEHRRSRAKRVEAAGRLPVQRRRSVRL